MNIDKTERLYNHFEDRKLFLKAAKLAFDIAKQEGLTLHMFQPKFRLAEGTCLGHCSANKPIKVITVLIRHRTDKQDGGEWYSKPLSWLNIENTTIHEIAHLKHADHSEEFWKYHQYLCNAYGEATKDVNLNETYKWKRKKNYL